MKKFLKNIVWRYKNLGAQKTDFGTKLNLSSYMDYLIFKEIFIDKIYDNYIKYSLNRNMDNNSPKRIFDIGGNLGFFTIRCCEIWNQIQTDVQLHFIIYEPSENCMKRLEKNLQGFDSKIFSFDIRNKLIGKKDGWDWFIEDKEHHLGQCVSKKIDRSGQRYSRRIAYDNITADLQLSKIDLLKCDIEGSEVEFLKNYSSSLDTVNSIIIETHGKKVKDFVFKKMQEIGFDCFHPPQDKIETIYSNLYFINGREEPLPLEMSDEEKEY